MTLDLEAIVGRHIPERLSAQLTICTFCSDLTEVLWPCDAAALVAEVRRLRVLLEVGGAAGRP